MFDLHITCTRKIKHLNIVFDDDDSEDSVESNQKQEAKPLLKEHEKNNCTEDLLMSRIQKTQVTKQETKSTHKTLPTDIINLEDRPKCYAEELNNLEI